MTTSAARSDPRPATALDRFLALVPVAVAVLALLSILFWEAAVRKSPTIFTDELEWSQLSRAIAHTGHAARRGQQIGFKSLYSFLLAPWWWLPTTASAYAAIKYVDTIVMSAAAIPTYLLGRMLVSQRAAIIAALGVLCTSAMFYATVLVPEVLAFPAFALCAYAAVRALSGGGRRWWIAAIVLSFVAIAVRGELVVAAPSLALAAALLWITGPRGRRLRADWDRRDYVGAVVALVAAFVFLNELAAPHAYEWAYTTEFWKDRIFHLGLAAGSALTIGLGVFPVLAGLASLWLPERKHDPAWRAFAAYAFSAILFFSTYTAVKAAYLSTNFATRVEERNLIYLAPLFLVGTAVYLSARRPPWVTLVPAAILTGWLALAYGYQLDYPYFEAPGYGIAVFANRTLAWPPHDIHRALLVAFAVSCALALAPLLRARARIAVVVAATAALGAWLITGQITGAQGLQQRADALVAGLPQPLDWVDLLTHKAGTTYLGQQVGADEGLWLLEFWNPSIKHVYSLDGTAPGPGPTLTPDLARPDGELSNDPGLPYVLADNGVDVAGKVLYQFHDTRLTQVPRHPWHLRQAVYGRASDGWIGNDASYAYFGPERKAGNLEVDVSRAGFCAKTAPNTPAVVTVGPVGLDPQRNPEVAHARFTDSFVLHNCQLKRLHFHIAPPVAVHVHVANLIKLSDYGFSDNRTVGATVGFAFTRSR